MRYENIIFGEFITRLNRFAALVRINGRNEVVHIKNTGRLRELLLPEAEIVLVPGMRSGRRTDFDLVSVRKPGLGWVNIDSQACNKVAAEWLSLRPEPFEDVQIIRPEYKYRESRFDFYMEAQKRRILMEVKGCTLERGNIGFFPDAPTERGVKHLKELQIAAEEGYETFLAFVISMPGVYKVQPNVETHPTFADVLSSAKSAGLKVLFLPCRVEPDKLEVIRCIEDKCI